MALYTDAEIRKLWREAKDKEEEIKILSELTLYSKERIRKIVAEEKKKMDEDAPRKQREFEDAVIRYYNIGWHVYEVAKIFGITQTRVVEILNENGIDLRYRRVKKQ